MLSTNTVKLLCCLLRTDLMSVSSLVLVYLWFAPLAVVFTAMFARVVFGQLVLAELLELVGHCLLQAHWQRVAEALETDKHCQKRTNLNRTDSTRWEMLSLCCRSWRLPANPRAAAQRRKSICENVAWWRVGWQLVPIRSWLWCECSAAVECKLPPEQKMKTMGTLYSEQDDMFPACQLCIAAIYKVTP